MLAALNNGVACPNNRLLIDSLRERSGESALVISVGGLFPIRLNRNRSIIGLADFSRRIGGVKTATARPRLFHLDSTNSLFLRCAREVKPYRHFGEISTRDIFTPRRKQLCRARARARECDVKIKSSL